MEILQWKMCPGTPNVHGAAVGFQSGLESFTPPQAASADRINRLVTVQHGHLAVHQN
jgi:hypothetical protein